ncbi:MAG: hypothetical protein AAF576_00535 [Pseudomonadota bacterium]
MSDAKKHKCTDVFLRECVEFDAAHILGAPFPVTLHGGVQEKVCMNCGGKLGHVFKKPRELAGMVAVIRACYPLKLNGAEIKFLRKCLGLRAKELARQIECDPAVLSRFENDKQVITDRFEKLLRAGVLLRFNREAFVLGVDQYSIMNMSIPAAAAAPRSYCVSMSLKDDAGEIGLVGSRALRTVGKVEWSDSCEELQAM